MRPPLQSPFRRALYQIPHHGSATDSEIICLRGNFNEIPGTREDLFDDIYKLRNDHHVLKKFGDVYFSPLHMHWVVGTFSRLCPIYDPMPTHVSAFPIYYQGTAAIVLDDPKNPQELLDFPIIPEVDFDNDQKAAFQKLFPRLVGVYVHRWGHVSMFFRNVEAIETTFESRFLPVRLGGLTYSFEILHQERNLRPISEAPTPQTGSPPITFMANIWNQLKHFVGCCGRRKPNLENGNQT
ncbi:hypothetical protein L873DRAFT_1820519 [Choiromyces venosus 120613-1]|uniref:Uncharacterized protein n=1 Tax=Choiromyces venosus 120613-1 TaxID=1336337 RepID=A0A3N4IX71_9PEZI|nr:hypothetical protein L873DRAFT_1820519 [Choiromyces venosus 120613-1]